MRNVTLILDNGTKFYGQSFGYEKPVSGEVVFNSAMTGYPECLTDPSFAGQIVTLTYPLVGNYGVPSIEAKTDGIEDFFESSHIQVSALIVTDYSEEFSHWNAAETFREWLIREQIPAITGVDTRELTKTLRENGVMRGRIVFNDENETVESTDYERENYAEKVSCKEVIRYNTGKGLKKVVLVDCGVKNSTIKGLIHNNVEVIRVPWNYNFNELEFDGLVVSNGPGNPDTLEVTIENLRTFFANENIRPCMGICMGHLLIAKAAGANTYKLKHGHRSQTQPVRLIGSTRCYITAQNQGYAIDSRSLPETWIPYFVNMNDGSNAGIKHNSNPWFTIQFQPEFFNDRMDTAFIAQDFFKAL